MTIEDWATRIDRFLLSDDRDILKDAGKISYEIACDKSPCIIRAKLVINVGKKAIYVNKYPDEEAFKILKVDGV